MAGRLSVWPVNKLEPWAWFCKKQLKLLQKTSVILQRSVSDMLTRVTKVTEINLPWMAYKKSKKLADSYFMAVIYLQ